MQAEPAPSRTPTLPAIAQSFGLRSLRTWSTSMRALETPRQRFRALFLSGGSVCRAMVRESQILPWCGAALSSCSWPCVTRTLKRCLSPLSTATSRLSQLFFIPLRSLLTNALRALAVQMRGRVMQPQASQGLALLLPATITAPLYLCALTARSCYSRAAATIAPFASDFGSRLWRPVRCRTPPCSAARRDIPFSLALLCHRPLPRHPPPLPCHRSNPTP